VPTFLHVYNATRAMALFAICNEALFRMIGHVHCKDRINTTNEAISTWHLNSRMPHIYERTKQQLHAVVKDLLALCLLLHL
jgi:hypothetical protein